MRIVTWNIRHGARSRIGPVLESLQDHNPDIVVLTEFRNNESGQRIRTGLDGFGLRHQSGFHAEPAVNSVLIAARQRFEEKVFDNLGIDTHRCVLAKFSEINLFGLYFAINRAKEPLFKFLVHLPPMFRQEQSMLIGDFNTGKHFIDEAGATFLCSNYFAQLEELGWADAWRQRHPHERDFSWCSNAGNGFRLDHAFVSPPLLPRLGKVQYSHMERLAKASDHSALILEII